VNLFGEILAPVQLRFNRASKFAVATSPRSGIRRFGPYDVSLFPSGEIKCGLIYPPTMKTQRDALVNGLINGDGSNFPGFASWFRRTLNFDPRAERQSAEEQRALRKAANDIANQGCDLVFVIVSQRNAMAYSQCKSALLCNGVPCQFVTGARLASSMQRPWVLSNIALASYAKVGGTPWVVQDTAGRRELIMGVSRAQDRAETFVVGFVTLYNQEGDFLQLHSKAPVIDWGMYVEGLEDLVIDSYEAYESEWGKPESLVIHFHKRPGTREIEAITRAFQHLGLSIPYALVHLNEFSLFRLFDTTHSSYVPQSGLKVGLSRHRALLLLDGREDDQRNRMGAPNVWDLSIDKRSTMPPDEFPRLVAQIHRFARVNWRGFNARSTPVTVNYSKLICDQVLEIGLDCWNSMMSTGKLRDKAWFL